ncbi:MAG: hypothetical protein WA941_07310 [Nitrososphaeraceae archaeon]
MINFLVLGIVALIALVIAATLTVNPISQAQIEGSKAKRNVFQAAPIAISGENVYIVWFSDKNMPNNNSEVFFRASNNGGATFGDKINLSNTTTADSTDTEIAADGDEVIVTWWERNQTSNESVFRASVDNGLTFGPLLKLGTNGTIGANE